MTTAKRSIDGIVRHPRRQPSLTLAPVALARPEPVATHVPGAKPLPHLAPYVPKVQHPPVTFLRPSHGEPRPPVVVDGTVRSGTASRLGSGLAPTPAKADITPAATTPPIRPAPPIKPGTPRRLPSQPFPIQPTQSAPAPAVLPAIAQASPGVTTAMPPAAAAPEPLPTIEPVKKRSKLWRILDLLQYPVLAVVALLAAQSTAVGQWFVLAYAVYAFIRRVPSQASFGMALFLLVSIPVFQLLHQPGIAQNTAVYVYELLVVGTVQAIIELYITRHKKAPRT